MFLISKAPLVGMEVSSEAIKGVELQLKGQRFTVVKRAQVDLPAGLLTETFTRPNIADVAGFKELLGRLRDQMDIRERSVGIALPDPVARVQILPFEKLPRREDEFLEIISWRLKRDKLLPYDPHEARITFQIMNAAPNTQEGIPVLISAVRKDVLGQYVTLFEETGLEPTAADLASFYGANLFEEEMRKTAGRGDTSALLQFSGKRFSLMIFHGDSLAFFRTKGVSLASGNEKIPLEVVENMRREIQSSITFFQDQTKGRHKVSLIFTPGSRIEIGALSGLTPETEVKRVFLAAEGNAVLAQGVLPDQLGAFPAATGAAMAV